MARTLSVANRSVKQSDFRYLVVACAEPGPAVKNGNDIPEEMSNLKILSEHDTPVEAWAESCRINEVLSSVDADDMHWTVVVMDKKSAKATKRVVA